MASRVRWQLFPQWIDAEPLELTEWVNDMEVIKGLSGYGSPPVEIARDQLAGISGASTRQVLHGVNEVHVPLHIRGDDFGELEDNVRTLVRQTNPVRGEVVLRRTSLAGRVSELTCRYTDGLRLDQGQMLGPTKFKVELVLQADHPYWQGETVQDSFTGAEPSPWFPMIREGEAWLGGAAVLGEVTIFNESDVEAWPLWTAHGPGNNPILTNHLESGDQVLALEYELDASDMVVFNTRTKEIVNAAGDNLFPLLTDRNIWALQPGFNSITLALADATNASYMAYNFRPATLMPL